jgi:hypothetical protein
MAAQKPKAIASTTHRKGQGMALRTDMRGALMVNLRKSRRVRIVRRV